MVEISLIRHCLAQFDISSSEIESLGNAGGFSGSDIYKIRTPDGTYCLKKWPVATDLQRLQWIHRVLVFAAANGCPELTKPLPTRDGNTMFSSGRGNWELTKWAEGRADFLQRPTNKKLDAAVDFLARFHQATARFHFQFSPSENVSKSMQRLKEFDSIASTSAASSKMKAYSLGQLREFGRKGRALAAELYSQLAEYQCLPLPSQPVIRDIRAEHLFFDRDNLVNVIDFGAMRVDSVACDLARLLGDCCNGDHHNLQSALDTYQATRPLTDAERQLVQILERTIVVVGVLNWMDWLFCQQRHFEDLDMVRSRIASLLHRFEQMT